MSQGIHLLYNSEIEDLYQQNTVMMLTRLREMALETPQASALEILDEAAALYGINSSKAALDPVEHTQHTGDVSSEGDQSPVLVDSDGEVASENDNLQTPSDVKDSNVASEPHTDITSSWSEDEEDDELLRDDPNMDLGPLPMHPSTPEPSLEQDSALESPPELTPEPEPEEVDNGPRFSLNEWGLPERIEDENSEGAAKQEERGPRRVVLDGIDE